MSKYLATARITEFAQIVEQPRHQPPVDRTFGLPTALYAITVAAYLAFLAVMTAAFGSAELAIPMAICLTYIAMAFGVPALWTRISPQDGARNAGWRAFRNHGVMAHDGPVSANAAIVQVLILPLAILGWGVAVAIIAAVT